MNIINDEKSKRLLCNKELLAYIMNTFIPEYQNVDRKTVLECIEKENNKGRYIEGIKQDEAQKQEDKIVYDILYKAALPYSETKIGLYINIEPQNRSSNMNNLLARATFYAARLISRQKGRTFEHQDFKDLWKVYSIWINTSPKKEEKGSINYYVTEEKHIVKEIKYDPNYYQYINIIILNLKDEESNSILEPLNILFTNFVESFKIAPNKVQQILKEGYNINMQEEELRSEWNLHSQFFDSGVIKGRKEGIKEGIKEGRKEEKITSAVEHINVIMNKMNISFDDAYKLLEIDYNIKNAVLKEFEKKLLSKQ